MTDNKAIVLPDHVQAAVQAYGDVVAFVRSGVMQKDTDYGVIPGTGSKPTLLKPGAEKLTKVFKLYDRITLLDKVLDWDRGLFHFQYQVELVHRETGEVWGAGIGSCNSYETKYRYRKGERICPNCGKAAIIKGKAEYGGGWLCFGKKGGCGMKFEDNDPQIANQNVDAVENPNMADLVNTIDKMAQKRGFIAATLIACAVSEFFTQDIEDMPRDYIDGSWREEQPATTGIDWATVPERLTPAELQLGQINRPFTTNHLREWFALAAKQNETGQVVDPKTVAAVGKKVGMTKAFDADADRLTFVSQLTGRQITSFNELTAGECFAMGLWANDAKSAQREAADLFASL